MESAFLVRWIHVSSASVILGGALLVIVLSLRWGDRDHRDGALLDLMEIYELAFWVAIGLLVMTGVGNLGHFGKALPKPSSSWGDKLEVKLMLVTLFVVFSLMRTLAVGLMLLPGSILSRRRLSTLSGMYGGTIVFILAILAAAIALAHFPSL